MILLALDAGRKKTGAAIGNTLTGLARPLDVMRGGIDVQMAAIDSLVQTWRPQKLVLGAPRHMNGKAHAMTKFCEDFSSALRARFGLPVELVDERLTTFSARVAIKGAKRNDRAAIAGNASADSVAAAIIMQNWLDAHR